MKKDKQLKLIKNLLNQLKFKRFNEEELVDSFFQYLDSHNLPDKVPKQKDLISTVRHTYSNYDELCKKLHMIDKSKECHRKFRSKVNGIIKQKYGGKI